MVYIHYQENHQKCKLILFFVLSQETKKFIYNLYLRFWSQEYKKQHRVGVRKFLIYILPKYNPNNNNLIVTKLHINDNSNILILSLIILSSLYLEVYGGGVYFLRYPPHTTRPWHNTQHIRSACLRKGMGLMLGQTTTQLKTLKICIYCCYVRCTT